MHRRIWYLIAGVMAVAALVAVVSSFSVNSGAAQTSASPAACASPMASPEASPAAMASPGASPTACGSPAAASGKTVNIEMVDIAFKPNTATIPANTPVKFVLKNTGALPHNFSIDKLHISVDVDPGKTGEVTINAPAGTYQFYCNVPGHKEAGMVGTLTVK